MHSSFWLELVSFPPHSFDPLLSLSLSLLRQVLSLSLLLHLIFVWFNATMRLVRRRRITFLSFWAGKNLKRVTGICHSASLILQLFPSPNWSLGFWVVHALTQLVSYTLFHKTISFQILFLSCRFFMGIIGVLNHFIWCILFEAQSVHCYGYGVFWKAYICWVLLQGFYNDRTFQSHSRSKCGAWNFWSMFLS